MTTEELDSFARDKANDEASKVFVARHPNASAKTLVYLLKYDMVELMGAIAAHKNTAPEILDMMVKSSDKLYTQYKLAGNPNTPTESLDELCDEVESEHVLLAVAQNPNTSQMTLKGLFDESSIISIEAQINYDKQESLKNKKENND